MSTIVMDKIWNHTWYTNTDEWKMKMLYIYTMEIYAASRNNKINQFAANWLALEDILSQVSQKKKVKHRIISLICGI